MITGLAEFLKHTVCTRCTVKLFSIHNGVETNLGLNPATNGSTNINTTTGEFKFSEIILYIPQNYLEEDTFGSAIRYKAVVQSERCEKPIEIFLDLPDDSVEPAPDLKLDMYDDYAVDLYKDNTPVKYPAGGNGYVKGTPVHEYQLTLERFRYLPSETANGVFGPKTDKATRSFQSDSTQKRRVDKDGGKYVDAQSVTFKGTSDGIVGPTTRDEIALWKRENYLRPLPHLYPNDYDREAVNQGVKSSPRTHKTDADSRQAAKQDDFHDIGTPVLEVQKLLQNIGAYAGKLDGWFGDKMKDAVKLFQMHAEKGEFIDASGKPVTLPENERLKKQPTPAGTIPMQDSLQLVEGKGLKIPAGEKLYGGYELKLGDNDKLKKWGGEVRQESGEFVKELKKDLLALGYWVSDPKCTVGKGMDCEGNLDINAENAIKTFQLEYFVIDTQGNIDASKKSKITGIADTDTTKKIKDKVISIGNKKWDRPGHVAKKKWSKRTKSGTGAQTEYGSWETKEKNYGNFYQLPPSAGYLRCAIDYGSKNEITNSKASYEEKSKSFEIVENIDTPEIMADCWGTRETIELLKNVGDLWCNKTVNQKKVSAFEVGDISAINGGPLKPHSTHQDGTGFDTNGIVCSPRDFAEEWHRDCALELAKLFAIQGAKRVLINCHYVIKNCSIAQQVIDHHHHFHVDGPDSGASPLAERFTSCNKCGIYNSCTKKIKYVRLNPNTPWVEYNRDAAKGAENGIYATGDSRTSGCVLLSNAKND